MFIVDFESIYIPFNIKYYMLYNFKSSNQSEDDKSIFISSKVKVGKSYKSKGWTLNRKDIKDLISVENFEGRCEVKIGDIISEAKLVFHPRLFYDSIQLEHHLKKLYSNGMKDNKLPLFIYFSEDNLFENVNSKYGNNGYLEEVTTSLRVGKSFKSKGWNLSKDIVSKF